MAALPVPVLARLAFRASAAALLALLVALGAAMALGGGGIMLVALAVGVARTGFGSALLLAARLLGIVLPVTGLLLPVLAGLLGRFGRAGRVAVLFGGIAGGGAWGRASIMLGLAPEGMPVALAVAMGLVCGLFGAVSTCRALRRLAAAAVR